MGSEDIVITKAFGVQTPSSSTQSTPEKKGHQNDASRGEDFLEYLKNGAKGELLHTFFDKEKKHSASSKYKITDKPPKTSNKGCKNQESKKISLSQSLSAHNQASKKLQRKGENPVRLQTHSDLSPNAGCSNTWICKNAACRATLSLDDTFCKRCSCCICHLFDDNKDPSLWLVCTSELDDRDSCGLSCHIECALRRQKVGVVDLGQLMQLDGSYCCASCGKVSGILGCWKKQLVIAKDARRVDILCYRIALSYRLLDGTCKYKELFEIVGDAKAKLETEVGSIDGVSARMARGIVSRLSISADLQRLCSLAIEKADSWLSSISNAPHHREDSLPAACRFQFEEVSSSSLIIVLKEICSSPSDNITGFKLWYCKSRDEAQSKEPVCTFPRTQRRVLISNLQPCTEYTFRIISYSDSGDLGHSEAKCFTKSVEILHKIFDSPSSMDRKNDAEGSSSGKGETKEAVESSGFKVRDLGKILRLAWAQEEGCFDGFCSNDVEECCGGNSPMKSDTADEGKHPFVARELDLNVASVPDLNAEVTPIEDSRDEDIECSSEQAAEDDVISHGTEKNGLVRSNGSGDSQTWLVRPIREVPAVESRPGLCGKRARSAKEDSDSTLINGSPFRFSGGSAKLDGSYEYCVKIIRWLECGGHIEKEFRMKFLTWFSLRSTDQERRVVNTFIKTLIDDPSSLAGQLIDSFSEIISSKRPRNGFCSKLWH